MIWQFSGLKKNGLCIDGRSMKLGGAYLDCQTDVFFRVADIRDAGISDDFSTPEDDNYVGYGLRLSAKFGFTDDIGVKWLLPFSLSANYRYMDVISGSLDNPDLFEASLNYSVPKTKINLSFTYTDGQNFITYQDIENLSLNLGVKF